MKLTTKERVKARLSNTTTGFDDLFDRLIEDVSGYIKTLLSTDIESATFTEYYDCLPTIITRNAPITAITSVEIDGGTYETPSLNDINYRAANRLGLINLEPGTTSDIPRAIKIIYTAGYVIDFNATTGEPEATHTLPAEITEVCERMVVRLFKRREDEGRTSESFDTSTVTWAEIIDKTDERILKAHSRLYQTS